MSWVGWAIAVGGPLLGIATVMALAVAHEHGRQLRRLPVRLPPAPQAARRASTALLEEYLVEERQASAAARRLRHARLQAQAQRASTFVLEEFLEERAAPPTPVRPQIAVERAPRPTRLVPLTPRIAIN